MCHQSGAPGLGSLSGDGTTLTGVWNQGRPMALNLTRVAGTARALRRPSAASSAPAAAASGDVTWDDYTFKFDASGRTAQVLEGGKLVGMIHTMNGEQQVMPLPGTDADKLKKSFADYKAFNASNNSGAVTAGDSGFGARGIARSCVCAVISRHADANGESGSDLFHRGRYGHEGRSLSDSF